MKRSAIVLPLLGLAANIAYAEQMYVSDKLVVGVYPEIDSENGKLANLETGDAVEALERQDKYIRIRLDDGREGWVKANYLTAQPPAIVRLKELQAAGSSAPASPPQLTQELAQLKEQNAGLLKEVDALKQAASKKTESAPAPKLAPEPIPEKAPTVATHESRIEYPHAPESGSAVWRWLLAMVATAGAGFAVGYHTFARRIRRKYGSVKII